MVLINANAPELLVWEKPQLLALKGLDDVAFGVFFNDEGGGNSSGS